jgi:hypothetical protein
MQREFIFIWVLVTFIAAGVTVFAERAQKPKIDCTPYQLNQLFLSPEYHACTELYKKSCYVQAKEKHCATKESGL